MRLILFSFILLNAISYQIHEIHCFHVPDNRRHEYVVLSPHEVVLENLFSSFADILSQTEYKNKDSLGYHILYMIHTASHYYLDFLSRSSAVFELLIADHRFGSLRCLSMAPVHCTYNNHNRSSILTSRAYKKQRTTLILRPTIPVLSPPSRLPPDTYCIHDIQLPLRLSRLTQ